MNIDLCSVIIGAVLGAILSLLATIIYIRINIWCFWLKNTRKLIGDYDVTLKNGNLYPNKRITCAKIFNAKGKMIEFEMEYKDQTLNLGNSRGQVVFSTENYGRGWYQHLKEPRYGFVELFKMSDEKLAFFRKYTTDTKGKGKDDNSFKSVETSFIWSKK